MTHADSIRPIYITCFKRYDIGSYPFLTVLSAEEPFPGIVISPPGPVNSWRHPPIRRMGLYPLGTIQLFPRRPAKRAQTARPTLIHLSLQWRTDKATIIRPRIAHFANKGENKANICRSGPGGRVRY
jgi:hypothetical protein